MAAQEVRKHGYCFDSFIPLAKTMPEWVIRVIHGGSKHRSLKG